MKLKQLGALLLALCMTIMVFPTTAMADENSISGPDAEKKVIENDLIVQLPSSLNDMIGTAGGDWLAIVADPIWEDGIVLDDVAVEQNFYDSTGKKMTADDTFQNNSQYMVETTFRSYESYYGDYYYVLSGNNNVYITMGGQKYPTDVSVDEDVNGNPVIRATYSFSIGTPPEEPEIPEDVTYELAVYGIEFNYRPDRAVSILEEATPYQVSLIRKKTDGTYELVDTDLYTLDFEFEQGDSYRLESAPHKLDNAYAFSIPSGGDLPVSDKACISAKGTFGTVSWAFPIKAYECQITTMDSNEVTKQMDVVIGETTQCKVQLFRTFEGKKTPVSTDSMTFFYNTVRILDDYLDISCDVYDNYYMISVTGKNVCPYECGCEFYFYPASDPNGQGKPLYQDYDDYYVNFNFIKSSTEKVSISEGLSKVTGDLGNTEYNTVEKIERKLTETIISNEGYAADNTVLYDVELVISEDGGETWIPVTAENFPQEGIRVTLPYPDGTNGNEYDFTVAHMFDEDVNGHEAGDVETPEVTKDEDGISFRLMGTSPLMIGYKKASAAHTHSYGEWTDCKDGGNHQRTCSCGDVQKETHVWDSGKVTKEATKDAEGIKTYTCKACGAIKTESIAKLDTTSPKTGDSVNIALWMAIMMISMAGLICSYFVRRKSKASM